MASKTEKDIQSRLDRIEKEIAVLKSLAVHPASSPSRILSLHGKLGDVEITEGDIKKAKESLFKSGT